MPEHEHTHGISAPHEHEGATPGHTHDAEVHDAEVTTTAPAPAFVESGPPAGGLTLRIVLTLLGAAAMIVGAFLGWFRFELPAGAVAPGTTGIDASWSLFYSTRDPFQDTNFFMSAGFVAIIIGLLALLGLAFRTGWLTRLAGALAIIAIVAYAITLYRVEGDLSVADIGLGAWLAAAGGLIALIGGFFGSRRVISAATVP